MIFSLTQLQFLHCIALCSSSIASNKPYHIKFFWRHTYGSVVCSAVGSSLCHNLLDLTSGHLYLPTGLMVRSSNIWQTPYFFNSPLKNSSQKSELPSLIIDIGVPNLEKIVFLKNSVTHFSSLLGSAIASTYFNT